MKTPTVALIALVLGLSFGASAMAEIMSKAQYDKLEKSIEITYRHARSECAALTGNNKDICIAEAKGNMRIAKAQLKVDYKPSAATRYDARIALAEADYAVAMERCDAKSDKNRSTCVLEAKAARASEIADVRAQAKASAPEVGGIINRKASDADVNRFGEGLGLDPGNSRRM